METILNNITNPFTVVGVLAVLVIAWVSLVLLWEAVVVLPKDEKKRLKETISGLLQDVTYMKQCNSQAPEKLDEIVNSKMHAVNALLRDVSITEENTNLRLKGLAERVDKALRDTQDIRNGIADGFTGQLSSLHELHSLFDDRLSSLEGSKEDEA